MGKLEIKEKRYQFLDVNEANAFRVNVDVLNEAFGIGRAMYARACYPDKKNTYFCGTREGERFFIWMPKLYKNSSEWDNRLSLDGKKIYEIAEPTRKEDWTAFNPQHAVGYRIVFAKLAPKAPYRFLGVFEIDDLLPLKHTYRRISTRIRLIGNPVDQIEMLDDER